MNELIRKKHFELYRKPFFETALQIMPQGIGFSGPILNIVLFGLGLMWDLPFFRGRNVEKWDINFPSYGFHFCSFNGEFPEQLEILYGRKYKFIYLPWFLDWFRTSLLLKDGTWAHSVKRAREEFFTDEWRKKRWETTCDYTYTTKRGETQHAVATIHREQMEWRPKWFKWTKLFAHVSDRIEIEFDTDIGEEKGEWKGGCTACSYELKKDESPIECIKRMEVERAF